MRLTTFAIEEQKILLRRYAHIETIPGQLRTVRLELPEPAQAALTSLTRLLQDQFSVTACEAVLDILEWLSGSRKIDIQPWFDANVLHLALTATTSDPAAGQCLRVEQVQGGLPYTLLEEVPSEALAERWQKTGTSLLSQIQYHLVIANYTHWLLNAGPAPLEQVSLQAVLAQWDQRLFLFNTSPSAQLAPPKGQEIPPPEWIRLGLLLELQKLGHPLHDTLLQNLNLQTARQARQQELAHIGLDHSLAQNKALFAVQKLLHRSNYLPTWKASQASKNGAKAPILKFTPAQYLEAYGVKKRQTQRGKMEFNANERIEALQALLHLGQQPHLLVYQQDYLVTSPQGEKEVRIDRWESVTPLLTIAEGLPGLEGKDNQRLSRIGICPSPIFCEGLDQASLYKPADCYQEIRQRVGKTSKYLYRLIDFLFIEVARQASPGQAPSFQCEKEDAELAMLLRLVSAKSKNLRQLNATLSKCCDIAQELGYLASFQIADGPTGKVYRLELNPRRFYLPAAISQALPELLARPS